jgi:hypothetical protein
MSTFKLESELAATSAKQRFINGINKSIKMETNARGGTAPVRPSVRKRAEKLSSAVSNNRFAIEQIWNTAHP